ncbi:MULTISPECIES: M20 family metallo-hydrolase [unclassified Enterococcus]|uniref:M20 family metallo-hydrolase n=1 Tax=unclassified Enterococcus TaxID=2608891 RepID=UPI0015564720|nr:MULTISPECIES: M20 family metallo-hydrolase [unclassified Enterococcus]MBS7577020.1 M20 family metallo-hydrolase [Enterococcus sp. MMGLQ5-2]MBS7584533.1 M20 family metallo-hydrolase [Enterococcus sp. MMGLQ5-1]NPD12388.1 M20 family metallo-hydrolase [Enterococcus sp. MMGLQ5-1]NPD36854.1 M20 family metallo-hydrolase [Enterococcus sp. MMGLQ5-2]
MKTVNLTINQLLDQIAQFTSQETKGVTRLLYDEHWIEAQKFLLELGQMIGLDSGFDQVGNVILTKYGIENDKSVITIGSHIDSVVNAGKYDGIYGVAAAIIAIKELLAEYGAPKKTIQVISFCEEEGSRFPFTFTGSKNLINQLPDDIYQLVDKTGESFEKAQAKAIHALKSRFPLVKALLPTAYAEIHIEQGPVLERLNKEIGIVTAIVAQKRFTVTITGKSNHAGTTPMWLRIDPLKQAVKMINQLEVIALEIGEPFVFTVGEMSISPNASNVIPEEAIFSIDIRHTDEKELQFFEELIYKFAKKQELELDGLEIEINKWTDVCVERMNETYIEALQAICLEKQLSFNLMPSGAGHDTQIVNRIAPTALLFVPSIDGISHSPKEFTTAENLEKGKTVFKQFIYDLAY